MAAPTRICIEHFGGSFFVFTLMGYLNYSYNLTTLGFNIFIFFISGLMIFSFMKIIFTGDVYKNFQIAWRAALLGGLFSLGFYIYLVCPNNIKIFGLYMSVMSFFHASEFMAIAIVQPNLVSTDSFVLNHSPEYTIAAVISWAEFFIEAYFFPNIKQLYFITYFGLVVCIFGEVLRKLAMFTAGSNFSHLVQYEKAEDHELVTTGVYGWFRHPSYVGWFYWAVGTQILLINPICIPAYALVSWMFFNKRIYIEEITLLNFFGQNYVNYQHKVGIGLPFIKGYQI
ncbi:protein-S-isoprenylcysteine O-methyltransferase [Sitophilus oryzae]|uniref:Protein-S-isoprenylcysteine O-methyltransferase n=1 Tax=Sitophilus oryzae TaxID=7048 RepID=A0A6J2YDI5_SITOR|nr:protein-S-isoprenylcysteine O-methyltransferase [Sitophilus oryzae]